MASRADFDRLTDALEDRAAALAASVAEEIGPIWTSGIIESSQRAVDAAIAETGKGAVANIVGDSIAVRAAIMEPVNARLLEIHDTLQGAMVGAVIDGYTEALFGRAEIHNRDGGDVVSVEVTDADIQQLQQFPIFGHPPKDWTSRMLAAAQWEYETLVTQPVIGQSAASAIPQRAAAASSAFIDAVRNGITQAFLSGTQAASEEWRQYLSALV